MSRSGGPVGGWRRRGFRIWTGQGLGDLAAVAGSGRRARKRRMGHFGKGVKTFKSTPGRVNSKLTVHSSLKKAIPRAWNFSFGKQACFSIGNMRCRIRGHLISNRTFCEGGVERSFYIACKGQSAIELYFFRSDNLIDSIPGLFFGVVLYRHRFPINHVWNAFNAWLKHIQLLTKQCLSIALTWSKHSLHMV